MFNSSYLDAFNPFGRQRCRLCSWVTDFISKPDLPNANESLPDEYTTEQIIPRVRHGQMSGFPTSIWPCQVPGRSVLGPQIYIRPIRLAQILKRTTIAWEMVPGVSSNRHHHALLIVVWRGPLGLQFQFRFQVVLNSSFFYVSVPFPPYTRPPTVTATFPRPKHPDNGSLRSHHHGFAD